MYRFISRLLIAFCLYTSAAYALDAAAIAKFHAAVHRGDVKTVKAMLATAPALAKSEDKYKFQPIHLMDVYFEKEILEALLANGADINAQNDEGITLLHIITSAEAIPLLLQKGANLEARDQRGWTPLIVQADNSNNGPDVVLALLARGADVNAKGNKGETALSFAQKAGDTALLTILRKAGAKQ